MNAWKKVKAPTLLIKVICLECGKNFATSKSLPECPKCGGSDVNLR